MAEFMTPQGLYVGLAPVKKPAASEEKTVPVAKKPPEQPKRTAKK